MNAPKTAKQLTFSIEFLRNNNAVSLNIDRFKPLASNNIHNPTNNIRVGVATLRTNKHSHQQKATEKRRISNRYTFPDHSSDTDSRDSYTCLKAFLGRDLRTFR